jgi:hypothetical protein
VTRLTFIGCFLTLAACGGNDPVDKNARNTAGLPDVHVSAGSASGEPRGATSTAEPSADPATKIPAALQGRWGMTPADCMPHRSDAKGLLVITADGLQFYESRAVPSTDAGADINSISGNFDFTGEGQNWTKYEALKVDKGRLTRTETKPTVSFSYARCS